MYAYFGGMLSFRSVLPVTGCMQLVLGIAGEFYIIWSKLIDSSGLIWPHIASVGLLMTYLTLYVEELREKF